MSMCVAVDDNETHAEHHHGSFSPSREYDAHALQIALALIVTFVIAEVIAAVLADSLALLADAGHLLTDAIALGASLWAAHLATLPAAGCWTFGFKRAEILSAAGNGLTLVVTSGLVTFESIHRLLFPSHVSGSALAAVAAAGVVVNLVVVRVLSKASRTSLNVEGSFRHVVTDLYGFIATFIAGIVIMTTHFERSDAIASLVIVFFMLSAARDLLKASVRVLLEGAPENVDLVAVRDHLLDVEHVIDVHDIHAWTVTSDLPTLSAHIVVEDECFSNGHAPQIVDQLQACLMGHFDIEHCTFQLEPIGHLDHESGTH